MFFDTIGSTNDEAAKRSASPDPSPQPQPQLCEASSSSPTSRRRAADGAATPGSRRRARAFTCRWCSSPATAAADPARATTLLTLAAGVAHRGRRSSEAARPSRRSQVAERPSGVAAASSAGSSPESSGAGDRSRHRRRRLRHQRPVDGVSARSCAIGRRRWRRSWDARSIAIICSPRRWRRCRGRYDDLLAGRFDAILDAWRRRAPGAAGARVTWTTNAGTASGVTAGIDDLGALLVRVDDRVERIISGEVVWA